MGEYVPRKLKKLIFWMGSAHFFQHFFFNILPEKPEKIHDMRILAFIGDFE